VTSLRQAAPATPADPPPNGEAGGTVLPALRQSRLANLVRERGQMTVSELVALFGVSRDTIRRDLDLLEQRGRLVRIHGGAIPSDSLVTHETTLNARMQAHDEAKKRIARAAVTLIRDGETLIVNGGSTPYYFAAELGERRDLTIVTNNLRIPPVVPPHAARAVYVLGGAYWNSPQVTLGPISFAAAARINADTAVIGVTGITVDGLSIARLEEAEVTSGMIGAARRTIVLADCSKFQFAAFAHVAAFSQIQHLVTDAAPPPAIAAALERADVQVMVVPPR
jgi:DeoR/GlpR family transcriptional regulator of sugar metabolism